MHDAPVPLGETIRPLTEEDAAQYWRLRLEALETNPEAFGSTPAEHQATPVAHMALHLVEGSPDSCFFGVFSASQQHLVAIARFVRQTGLRERHKGHLYGVYVTPSYRGRGCADRLLTAILDRARQDESLEQVLLAVRVGEHAAGRLYRRLGFQTFGVEPRALKVGSVYLDEEQMILRLR